MSRDTAMTITLTPEIEQALTEEARKLGMTPEQLALRSLRERFVPRTQNDMPDPGQGTLADFLAGYIGVLDSGEHFPEGARMSEDVEKTFTELLIKKHQRRRS